MKAVLYCRVSTDEQSSNGVSLSMQEARCFDYARSNGFEVVETISDNVSGKNLCRTGIDRLLQLVTKKSVQAVLVYKLDRLSRKLSDLLGLIELLKESKVVLVSLQEQLDSSTPVGYFTLSIMGALAEMERSLIVSRVKDALAHMRKQGKRTSRFAPFGFGFDESGKNLVSNLSEQRTIQTVMYCHKQKMNYSQIARALEEKSIPSRVNGKWYPEQVKRIIKQFNEPVGL